MTDVTAIGELLIDFAHVGTDDMGYPTMAAHPGGAPANFLAAVNKFGRGAALLGKVGGDAFGRALISTLRDAGIETRGVVVDDKVFTTLAFVTFDEHGDRAFSFARKPGADTQLSFEELDLTLVDECRVLHFGTLSLTDEPSRSATEKVVAYAREKGKLISFDPNLRKPLWRDLADAKAAMLWGLREADIVKISDEEVEFLFGGISNGDAAEKLHTEFGVRLVFITLGRDGCYYSNGAASGALPALLSVDTIDTTGAGDIFGGSAMWRFLETGKAPEELSGEELSDIVAFATAAAGLSTARPGGISSVPAYEEVLEYL